MMNMKTKTLNIVETDNALFAEVAKGGTPATRAMNTLVNRHMGMVITVAKRYKKKFPACDMADLVSEASESLMKAIKGFDPERGFTFSTYAIQAMSNACQRVASTTSKRKKLNGASYEVAMPTIHDRTNHRQEKEKAVTRSLIHDLAGILSANNAKLTPTEMIIVEKRYGLYGKPMKLEDIGNELGVSKERVRQLQEQALRKLRGVLESSL